MVDEVASITEVKGLSVAEPSVRAESSGVQAELEACAQMMGLYMPVFKDRVKKLKPRQLRRLLVNLVEHPLSDKPYKPKEKEERDLFLIGDRLLQAKFSMVIFAQAEAMEAYVKKNEENKNGEDEASGGGVGGEGEGHEQAGLPEAPKGDGGSSHEDASEGGRQGTDPQP